MPSPAAATDMRRMVAPTPRLFSRIGMATLTVGGSRPGCRRAGTGSSWTLPPRRILLLRRVSACPCRSTGRQATSLFSAGGWPRACCSTTAGRFRRWPRKMRQATRLMPSWTTKAGTGGPRATLLTTPAPGRWLCARRRATGSSRSTFTSPFTLSAVLPRTACASRPRKICGSSRISGRMFHGRK